MKIFSFIFLLKLKNYNIIYKNKKVRKMDNLEECVEKEPTKTIVIKDKDSSKDIFDLRLKLGDEHSNFVIVCGEKEYTIYAHTKILRRIPFYEKFILQEAAYITVDDFDAHDLIINIIYDTDTHFNFDYYDNIKAIALTKEIGIPELTERVFEECTFDTSFEKSHISLLMDITTKEEMTYIFNRIFESPVLYSHELRKKILLFEGLINLSNVTQDVKDNMVNIFNMKGFISEEPEVGKLVIDSFEKYHYEVEVVLATQEYNDDAERLEISTYEVRDFNHEYEVIDSDGDRYNVSLEYIKYTGWFWGFTYVYEILCEELDTDRLSLPLKLIENIYPE